LPVGEPFFLSAVTKTTSANLDTVRRAASSLGTSLPATVHRHLQLAGVWDEWKDKASGETLKSCTMIITEPNKFVAEVHDRMPVLLAEKDYAPWLSGNAGLELLKPAAENVLQKWPVSKRVNSSRAPDDDPTLIDKIAI
jgi:putative SOS response-associated peptidase YedK